MRFRVCAQDEIRQHMVLVSVTVNTSLPFIHRKLPSRGNLLVGKNHLFIGSLLQKPNLKSKSGILENIKDPRLISINILVKCFDGWLYLKGVAESFWIKSSVLWWFCFSTEAQVTSSENLTPEPLKCSMPCMVLVPRDVQCSAFPGTGWGREFLTNIHFWCATKMPYGVKLVITAASNRVLFLICDIFTKKSLQACLLVLSSHISLAKSLMRAGNDLEKSVLHRHFCVVYFKGSYY